LLDSNRQVTVRYLSVATIPMFVAARTQETSSVPAYNRSGHSRKVNPILVSRWE
jgi:hypothetical protein